jgi:hypothetical protein
MSRRQGRCRRTVSRDSSSCSVSWTVAPASESNVRRLHPALCATRCQSAGWIRKWGSPILQETQINGNATPGRRGRRAFSEQHRTRRAPAHGPAHAGTGPEHAFPRRVPAAASSVSCFVSMTAPLGSLPVHRAGRGDLFADSVILLVHCVGHLLGVENKSIRWQVICMPAHLEAGPRFTQRTISRRISMTPFIALVAIVATIKLSVRLGSDDPSCLAGGWVTRPRAWQTSSAAIRCGTRPPSLAPPTATTAARQRAAAETSRQGGSTCSSAARAAKASRPHSSQSGWSNVQCTGSTFASFCS